MTVTIDDPKLDEQLAALSDRLGKSVEELVHDAVQDKIKRSMSGVLRKIDWDSVRMIQARVAASPVLRQGTADELVGYNEFGTFD